MQVGVDRDLFGVLRARQVLLELGVGLVANPGVGLHAGNPRREGIGDWAGNRPCALELRKGSLIVRHEGQRPFVAR